MRRPTLLALPLLALSLAAPASAPLAAQIAPNSRFFVVRDYYHSNGQGDLVPYRAAGFAQPAAAGGGGRLSMLPALSVRSGDVRFTRADGTPLDRRPRPGDEISSISIRTRYDAALPDARMLPAIASVLENGVSLRVQVLPWQTGPDGLPTMFPPAAMVPQYREAVLAAHRQLDAEVASQAALAEKYKGYQAELASLNELRLELLIDGEPVASRSLPGSSVMFGSTLPALSLPAPTPYQVNKVASGDFEVMVRYRFLDARTASIQARIDARQAVRSFLEETQQAITRSRSSGWQVFGIGSRRTRVSRSMNQSVTSSFSGENLQGTRIVMNDADEAMIERFEAAFFPQISKAEAIERHLAAVEVARASGNEELAKAHADYAASLQGGVQMAEVDALAAAAALSSGNYAAFVANGVRMSSSSNARSDDFRRVINQQAEFDAVREWDEVRTVSVQREVSVPVAVEREVRQLPRLGMYDAVSMTYTFFVPGPWGLQPESRPGMLVTTIETGGPMHRAGIMPGMIVTSVNGQRVTTAQGIGDALAGLEPGERIVVRTLEATPPMQPSRERRHDVVLGRGQPVAQSEDDRW